MPDENITFEYSGVEYSIYADGENGEYGNLEDYELFITRNEGSTSTVHSITSHAFFDDTMVEILFIGDIDGDEVPDMIIEDSNKYSFSKPVLLLSRPSSEKEIFVRIGEKEFYSC